MFSENVSRSFEGAGDSQSADDAREAAEQLRDAIEKNRGDAEIATGKLTTGRHELAQRNLYAHRSTPKWSDA